jgi:hypothetical protein
VLPIIARNRCVKEAAGLVEMAVHLPEPPERGEQPGLPREIARGPVPGDCDAQVVVIVLERAQPAAPIVAEQVQAEALGQAEEEFGVPAVHVCDLRARLQALDGKRTDRLEHEAGSVIVLLLWVYYSAQILLLGAEFTRIYAETHGSRPRPQSFAEPDPNAPAKA